ncbi:MAG: Rid family detoxifying hydrolase [Candidatus Cybelea sp.]
MKREHIATRHAPQPIGPYSQAIQSGGELYCSGQIPLDPETGEIVPGDAAVQTERVIENLGAILCAAGFHFEDVVKTTVFLVDMNDFPAVNAVYEKYFGAGGMRPKTRLASVMVGSLPPFG